MTILVLKLVLTPALIALATLAGRRFGPSISGWLVGLPFTSGPVSFFLALEQGTSFAAAAAAGSIAGAAATTLFAVVYAAAARRAIWVVSLALASAVFLLAIVALDALPLGSEVPLPLVPLYVGTIAASVVAMLVIAEPRTLPPVVAPPPWDLPARMAVATVVVLVVTGVAPILGPQLSGLVTTYPIYASVLAAFGHAQRGGAAAIHVVRGLCFGLLAFASFFFVIGVTLNRVGVALAYAGAITTALGLQVVTLQRLRTEGSGEPQASRHRAAR